MSLNIQPITNPHTDGRGKALVMQPEGTEMISVRYDEYDYSPNFFVSMHGHVELVEVQPLDDGYCSLRLHSQYGEVTLILEMSMAKFANSLDAARAESVES